jgi:DNA-binding transcriptional MerR regulator
MISAQETYLRSHEVADIFGVSTQTIYNWLRKGRIAEPKRHPVTRYRLWTPQDVERIRRFLAEEKVR